MNMLKSLSIVVLLISGSLYAQPLRDINYRYLYDPDEVLSFDIDAAKTGSDWLVYYSVVRKDTTVRLQDISIEWETRESLNSKERQTFSPETTNLKPGEGSFKIPVGSQHFYLVAKITNRALKRSWFFYKLLEPASPVNAYLEENGKAVQRAFVNVNTALTLRGLPSAAVSYYNDVFPQAQPPFSEGQARVSKSIKADSLFKLSEGETVTLTKKGMYLFQSDTNATNGVTVRVEEDYPKLAKIQSLVGPLVFISTAQEYNKLVQSRGDKKTFDRVVLSITNDQGRARNLMRNYFKRVEMANQYFTSYKEGWKTDRGMIYIVFGLPDEVFKFTDREIWNYNDETNVSFTFVRSSSLFDPDNYVLLRDKKYQQAWYQTIDLWRGARF